jgi:DNA-directed RNA polymerase subunit L
MSKKQADSVELSNILLPNVDNSIEQKGILSFTLNNTNVSIANALRRVILADISTVIVDTDENIEFHKNTTKFHNEILKQRLGCIPVHIKEHDTIENLEIHVDVQNDIESMRYVTTNDFKIYDKNTENYLDEHATEQIFPADRITDSYILFTRLTPKISNDIPGEVIHFKTTFNIGTALQSGMYNVASTCAYANTPDPVKQNEVWQDREDELEQNGITSTQINYEKANWYTLDAKRYYKKDSFDFKLETIGVYTNIELIHLACDNIIQRLLNIIKLCDSQKLQLINDKTAMKYCVDIRLDNEDYTIGKIIEYILHEQYYKVDKLLSYVGFLKKHPHDDFSIIRIAFNQEEKFTPTNIIAILKFSCQNCINIYQNIKEFF